MKKRGSHDQLMEEKPLTGLEKQEIEALFNLRDPDPDRLLDRLLSPCTSWHPQ